LICWRRAENNVAETSNTQPSSSIPLIFHILQLDLWIQHVANVLKNLKTDQHYIQTGVVPEYDGKMLHAVVVFANHFSVVQRMDHAKFLDAWGDLGAACAAPCMPSPRVAQFICWFCNNFYTTSVKNGERKEEILKKLVSSRLLGQTIRCATIPPEDTSENSGYEEFFDVVLGNCFCICKSLRSGRATGNILSAVLDGRDGFTPTSDRNPGIVCRLTNLARICDYAKYKSTVVDFCRKCNEEIKHESGSPKISMACTRCEGKFPWRPAFLSQLRWEHDF